MSQMGLFGIESYQDTRRPAKGASVCKLQLALFTLQGENQVRAKTADLPRFKRGEIYYVERTGIFVRFIQEMGRYSLWRDGDGNTWRATRALLELAGVRALH